MKNDNPNLEDSISQNTLILQHLQTGATLTGFEALELFKCFRLPSRVCDLKKAGHNIVGKYIKTPTGKRIMQYRLVE